MFGENEYSKRMSLKRLPVGKVIYIVRSFRRRRVRTLILLSTLSVLYFLILLPLSLRHSHSTELASYDAAIAQIPPPRVFIAAMLANCAPLLSQYWVPSLLSTIDKLGPPNVYVSILENGSVDGSRNVLLRLEDRLKSKGVEYTIRYEEDFRDGAKFQEKGLLHRILGDEGTGDNWIMTDKGWLPRRISYLAELRNMVLDPLKQATQPFDKILFINDVIFSAEDVVRLLHTNGGDYAAACGLDYFRPHLFYDTFAMRDTNGNPTIAILFPFFPRGKTREQLLARSTNVEVKSCWNGMISLNAAPFQNETSPLHFRAISGSLALTNGYLEASEACLINADMQSYWAAHMPTPKIFVNPLVRVSYTSAARGSQNSIFELFLERVIGPFVAIAYDIRDWWVSYRLAAHQAEREEKLRMWEEETGEREAGDYCLSDQMQLLTPWGWTHV